MAKSKGGFTDFTDEWRPSAEGAEAEQKDLRIKAKGAVIHISLRLTHEQWERVTQLANAEGTSINRLAIHAFSKLFQEKGLPAL
jgi:hypothetical protein